jgi:hypothetical protein
MIRRLFAPVDAAGIAYFRIAFYCVMLWEAVRYVQDGWIQYFSGKHYYFGYWPLEFVKPLPGEGVTVAFYVMAVCAVLAILGLFYRVGATAFFLVFTYIFLIEKARYLNHLYLVCLISFLMIFVPAHRCFSLDARFRRALRSDVVPTWALWLLRFQVGVPMFFGGVAKLNADWFRGEPLRAWLANRTDFPLLGPLFTHEPLVWLMTYWAIFFDMFAPFFLLHRRTRVFAYMAALHFHFMNSRLFGIGIFPWAMIASTVIFFEPDWPRRLLRDLRGDHPVRAVLFAAGCLLGFMIGGFLPERFSMMRALIGALGVGVAAYHIDEPFRSRKTSVRVVGSSEKEGMPLGRKQKWTFALLGAWVVWQVLFPLRHYAIPGDVHWTEEGHNFSWHMKLRDKDSHGYFAITDKATGDTWSIDPGAYLSDRQLAKMLSRPHMIIQFVRFLEGVLREDGHADVEIRARIEASLNGRQYQTFIDPQVDLTQVPYPWFGHAEWILPLETPLESDR